MASLVFSQFSTISLTSIEELIYLDSSSFSSIKENRSYDFYVYISQEIFDTHLMFNIVCSRDYFLRLRKRLVESKFLYCSEAIAEKQLFDNRFENE